MHGANNCLSSTNKVSLVNVLKASNQTVPEDLLKFGTTVKKKLHPVYGAFYREPAADLSDVPAKITFDD
jgi:ATP-dependent RNA helicase DBP3